MKPCSFCKWEIVSKKPLEWKCAVCGHTKKDEPWPRPSIVKASWQ